MHLLKSCTFCALDYPVKGMLFPINKNGINGQLYSRVVGNIMEFPKVYSDIYLCSWDENPTIQSPLKLLCCFWAPLRDRAFTCSSQKKHLCFIPFLFFMMFWVSLIVIGFNSLYLAAIMGESICSCILYLLIFISCLESINRSLL